MGWFSKKEIEYDLVNAIKHQCRKCNKMIGVYGCNYGSVTIDELCNCDDPDWYTEVIQVKIYKY